MYVEYKEKNSNDSVWRGFGGRINPGRNYFMFGIICEGVRCDTPFNFPARGMPSDAAYDSRHDNQLYISDKDGDGYVTMERAQQWVDSGSSQFIFRDGKPIWVTNPDWHSHSWLSTQEFEKALDFYRQHETGLKYPEPEYEALLSSMKRFEELGFESRVVFWFDN